MKQILAPMPLHGEVDAISSKSHLHRLLICAAFSWEPTKILFHEYCEDITATMHCLAALGADFFIQSNAITVYPIRLPRCDRELDCGESGATLRFMLPIVGAIGVPVTFRLRGRLAERPIQPLWEEMERHGCRLSRPSADTLRCEGTLSGGTYRISTELSTQFVSGLLLAAPLFGETVEILVDHQSGDGSPIDGYIALTKQTMAAFGVPVTETPEGFSVPVGSFYHSPSAVWTEGDWSNAAFFLCAGAISAPVTVRGLRLFSRQPDREILSLLQAFGADVLCTEDGVTVSPNRLHAVTVNAERTPDLVPPLAAVAACAEGTTVFTGAARLRGKESDRLQTIADALNAIGGCAEITQDGLRIAGKPLSGGCIDSRNDHRIAMLAGILSSVCSGEITLSGAEAVCKSYPGFWEAREKLL